MKERIKQLSPLLLLSVISFVIIWPLLMPGYFSHHDDLQIMRIFEMRRCLEDGQIPCRWVPDMGYGYGFPLFNYYGVVPYYLGALFSFAVGFIWASKMLFAVALVLGGFSMYLLGKEVAGKIGGTIAGVLYLLAPFRALDSYVRGALTESFAMAVVPFIFYFSLRLAKKTNYASLAGLSLMLAIFLATHNIMSMFFVPFIIVWAIYWLAVNRWKNVRSVVLGLLLGFGLSAFYVIPAFVEKSLVQVENLTDSYLNFNVHFVSVSQLFFNRFWDFGNSVFGSEDTMSFQIGWPHWWLALLAFLAAVLSLYKKYISKGVKKVLNSLQYNPLDFNQSLLVLILFLTFLGSLFLMHNRSTAIWESLALIQFAQFPWRLLSVAIFTSSILAGIFISSFKGLPQKVLLAVVILLTVFLNIGYFKPETIYFLEDSDKLSGEAWEGQRKAIISDYLPKTAEVPLDIAPLKPYAVEGLVAVDDYRLTSHTWEFGISAITAAKITVPVFEYPDWQVMVNNKNYPHSVDPKGMLTIVLPQGEYIVKGELKDTPIRSVANILSLTSLFVLLSLGLYAKVKKLIR